MMALVYGENAEYMQLLKLIMGEFIALQVYLSSSLLRLGG